MIPRWRVWFSWDVVSAFLLGCRQTSFQYHSCFPDLPLNKIWWIKCSTKFCSFLKCHTLEKIGQTLKMNLNTTKKAIRLSTLAFPASPSKKLRTFETRMFPESVARQCVASLLGVYRTLLTWSDKKIIYEWNCLGVFGLPSPINRYIEMFSMQRTSQAASTDVVQFGRKPFWESSLRLGLLKTYMSKEKRGVRASTVALVSEIESY